MRGILRHDSFDLHMKLQALPPLSLIRAAAISLMPRCISRLYAYWRFILRMISL